MKASESEVDSDSKSNPKGGKWIIDTKPSAIITTTKVQPSEPEEPEEWEHLFHLHMWVRGAPLYFIVNSGNQNNLISTKVIKKLDLSTTPHLHPYMIEWLRQGRDICVIQ